MCVGVCDGKAIIIFTLSVGSDIECRKPQLKLYEERERKREREGGIFLLFLEVMVVLGAPC